MVKNTLLWLAIIGIVVVIFSNLDSGKADADMMNYSAFVTAVSQGEIKDVKISGEEITGTKVNGSEFETVRPEITDNELMPLLREHNVEVQGTLPERQRHWHAASDGSIPNSLNCRFVLAYHARHERRRCWWRHGWS